MNDARMHCRNTKNTKINNLNLQTIDTMITYSQSGNNIIVYLQNKKTGEIRKVDGGYQYFPNGSKNGGEILPTIAAVKKSLEE